MGGSSFEDPFATVRYDLADGHVQELFSDSWNPLYGFNADFVEALDKRVISMKTHRDDAVSPCVLPEQL